MTRALLQVLDLAYRYPDGTEALRGLSFELQAGEAVAVVGANGAGKSTLLHHLNGTLLPARGTVTLDGLPVTAAHLSEVRQRVGLVFQDPDDQLFMPTVAEDVAFGPLNLGLAPGDVAARVQGALAAVEALDLAALPPYRLSAGQKRRVAVATALAMAPALLVLDEPTSGLDPRGRSHLARLLQTAGSTQILATHDLDLVVALCPRTLMLHQGRLLADGPTRVLFRDLDLLARCHLEQPWSMRRCPVCGEA